MDIPNAKPSPRIVNGTLYWYAGDTFDLDIELELFDRDNEKITIGASDTVKIAFKNGCGTVIKEFALTEITNNTVTLDFDAECTALFSAGEYRYDVYYSGEERTTVADGNLAIVE